MMMRNKFSALSLSNEVEILLLIINIKTAKKLIFHQKNKNKIMVKIMTITLYDIDDCVIKYSTYIDS